MKPDICIYHGNCADGFTAAWAVWKRFGDDVEYVQGIYGQEPPDITGKHVVIVDFSYKRPVLEEMAKQAQSILVLDHHKTAKDDLAAGGKFVQLTGEMTWERHLTNLYQDDCENANLNGALIYSVFDMERSGAGITWDVLHPNDERPALIRYVEDRDLWRFNLPYSREVNAYIFAHKYEFQEWLKLESEIQSQFSYVKAGGAAIEKKHHKDVSELVAATKRTMKLGGHEVAVANLPYTMSSDAGHLMSSYLEDQGLCGVGFVYPFAACYWDTPKGRIFSLRSQKDGGADVSEIAKQYGGGGHKNAAGFTMPIGWEGDEA